MKSHTLDGLALLAARVLISAIFIYDATLLVRSPVDNASFMTQFGVPAMLLYPTAAFQFIGGLMIVCGVAARPISLAFSGFCVLTAAIFHHDLSNAAELIQFGKDIGLAGGFLCLCVQGPGLFSIDGFVQARRLHKARSSQANGSHRQARTRTRA